MTDAVTPASPVDSSEAPPMPRRSWMPLVFVGVVLLACLAWLAKISGTVERVGARPVHRYILPVDFTGKIRILYNVPGAPALEEVEGRRVLRIPMSGMLETSTPFLYGSAADEFFRARPDGTLEHLRGNYLGERKLGVIGDKNEYFDSPSETELWRQEMVRRKMVDANGDPLLGGTTSTDPADMIHYEMMIVRENL